MTDESPEEGTLNRERDELYRYMVESATDFAIFSADPDRLITSWNVGSERLMGWSEKEILGQSADIIFTPEDREKGDPAKEATKAFTEGRAQNKRWHLRKDGSRFWGDGLMLPLKDDAGDVRGLVKIFRDRTSDLKAEETRKDADRRKDEFLAILAHELRNPLAAIGNAAQIALREDVDSEALSWSGEVIARQVKNLSVMIDDLLDISRINLGKIQLKQEPLHVGPVIARAVESVSHLIEEKKHELNVSVATGAMRVKADPTRLEQVITNLLSNAVKYTDPGGSISITAAPEDDDVVIRVKGNGIGLTTEMLSEVFELFAQVEKTLDRARGGLGIGLAVVKKLVEMHGGSVDGASDGPDRGSEFTIRMPALKEKTRSGGGKARPVGEMRSRRILVVDDSVDTAIGMARLLRMVGHEVEIAHDGNAAVEAARSFLPDILLLDIGLPGLNGYEVAAMLRKEENFKNNVFIAASGYGQDHDRERSKAAGFNHHISKPVDFDLLVELIASPR
jgi:PAS domain S-box-containing protein